MRDREIPANQDRFPGYDVLTKRLGPSWNERTRRIITRRLSVPAEPRFFTPDEFQTVKAIAERIVPQPSTRAPIPVAALVDERLFHGRRDGYRLAGMPRDGDAWRLGLTALNAEAEAAYVRRFCDLSAGLRDCLLMRMQSGELKLPQWSGMRSEDFFNRRMARDIVLAYYSHPTAWSEIGWGGPASPRGYVRLDFDERDPWEAAEATNGAEASARRINGHVR